MSKSYIPQVLRRLVRDDAQGQCAYCHTLTEITGASFVIDHIIPEAFGGETVYENLCLACHSCNEYKGARLVAQDPATEEMVALFHPHLQEWREHFRWSHDGIQIVGLTAIGRATVMALNMNHTDVVKARRRWVNVGWHPPQEDL
ncbi:MAG: HNH endonuclease [Caldilineaceae bacterium]